MSSQYYVGIDLGTVNTCLAFADENGRVEISKNEGSGGLLPSTILFTDKGKYVGAKAIEKSTDYSPTNCIFHFKRMMGTDYKRVHNGVVYDPSEMSAIVMKKALMGFEAMTGTTVDSAVITIPGDFSDSEKNATIAAAKMVGISKVDLLNESIAAAIAHNHVMKFNQDRKVIIYDLGGGTLDVTVISIEGDVFNVLSDESSKDLGGKDWDLQLSALIEKKILESCGMTSDDIVSDSEFRLAVIAESERQKIMLEKNDRTIGSVKVKGRPVKYMITKTEFEDATFWLMMKTIDMVGYALRNARLTMKEIDSIILVGGSTQMHQVYKSLQDAFPSKEIISFDPQHAVARGAAIYAKSLYGDGKIRVKPVSTRTIGILAGIDGQERICNVIFRNTPLPISKRLMFRPKRDEQKLLEINIYESLAKEEDDFIDIKEGKLLSKNVFELSGRIMRGKTKIPIRFIADVDGRISVAIECNGVYVECEMCEPIPTFERIEESMAKIGDIL